MGYEPRGLSILFPTYQIFTAIAFILSVIPIPAHWSVGNVATVSLGLWVAGGNLLALINTLVWRGNLKNPHPIWGDICAFYWAVMGPAIASCSLAIIHRLYNVSKSKRILITKAEKRRQLGLTWFLCWGVPFIIGGLRIIVQENRYDILEDVGPMGTNYLTPLTFVIYLMWDPLICLISSIYYALTIRWYLKQRKEIDAMFRSFRLTRSSYTRLLMLSACGIAIHLPISTYVVIINAAVFPIYPYTSWDDVHSNLGQISYINRSMFDDVPYFRILTIIEFSLVTASGICYFIFFGFGKEAFKQYKSALIWLFTPLGLLGNRFHRTPPAAPSTTAWTSRPTSFFTYLSNVFSSFGTAHTNDLGRSDEYTSQVTQITERDSQSLPHPHISPTVGSTEVQLPPVAHPARSGSVISSQATSNHSGAEEIRTKGKEKDNGVNGRRFSHVHSIRRHSEQLNAIREDESADPTSISEQPNIVNTISYSNSRSGGLEVGTAAQIHTTRVYSQQDEEGSPELTEEVTF